jgi:uroporphyrinogen decarboxylase
MQSSKEVIKSAIEFKTPERLPVLFNCFNESDVWDAGWNQTGTGDNSKRLTYDEWGCGWSRTEMKNMGQIKYHPLSDWENINSFHWPDPQNPAFFEGMEQKFKGAGERYVNTGIFMLLFERMHGLRGFENTLTDLYLERENIGMLADRIVDFDITLIRTIASKFPGKIDGFTFTDDWGTEKSLFISPALWREFFKPRYKKIFDACHAAGWHVWMHSCGHVNEIIGDLIEIGLNVINLQQPRALGIEEIGQRYAGKICFQSLCDIQRTLPFEDAAAIHDEARLLLKCWGTDTGGFILSDYGDGDAIGVPIEKKRIMFDAFKQYDRWSKNSSF